MRSPFRSRERSIKLLDTVALRALSDYAPAAASEETQRAGAEVERRYTRAAAGGGVDSVDLVLASFPSGGHEIYVFGTRTVAGRAAGENPDLGRIQAVVQSLVDALVNDPGTQKADEKRLAYEMYTLSYTQSDRAMALLKALKFTTIEYAESAGESLYNKVYTPVQSGEWQLPVVVKLLDARKTSLQDPQPLTPEMVQASAAAAAMASARAGASLLPDLGGVYLHHTTNGDPEDRLLVVYDPEDTASLQRLLNLLHDKVDVPAPQIVIEALVIEIEGDVSKDLGVSFDLSGTAHAGKYRDDYQTKLDSPSPMNPFTFLFNRTSPSDVFKFNATLRALLEKQEAKILSNPSVLVLDGRQAKIQIGTQIPVVETTTTNVASQQSVTYFPVGIVLNLRPRITEDASTISMQVETIVSSVRASATTETVAIAPEVDNRQVQTFVRVANDTPFIIGGLTSNEETREVRGIPGLAKLPILGPLFSRTISDSVRKEVIIVVTPHIVPQETKNFTYVIPQQNPIFDSYGHQLFYSGYRVQQRDVFDLAFLSQSRVYNDLVACARRAADPEAKKDPIVQSLVSGRIPGEEILVRRMLWETVRRTGYMRFVNLDKVIFFEDAPDAPDGSGFKLAYLRDKLPDPKKPESTLLLTFDGRAEGTPEHPFAQPKATVSYDAITKNDYMARLTDGNRHAPDGKPLRWTVMISDAHPGTAAPLDLLKGVLVLKRLLTLNANLPLTIEGFHAGRQIVYPTESDIRDSFLLIDTDTARLFYEVTNYYGAFEQEFMRRGREISRGLGGCAGWEQAQAPTDERSGAGLVAVAAATGEPSTEGSGTPTTREPRAVPAGPRPPSAPIPAVSEAVAMPGPADAASALDVEQARRAVTAAPSDQRPRLQERLDAAGRAFQAGRTAAGYLEIGRLYLDARLNHAALAALRRAESLDRASADVHRALFTAYVRCGSAREGQKHLQLAQRLESAR